MWTKEKPILQNTRDILSSQQKQYCHNTRYTLLVLQHTRYIIISKQDILSSQHKKFFHQNTRYSIITTHDLLSSEHTRYTFISIWQFYLRELFSHCPRDSWAYQTCQLLKVERSYCIFFLIIILSCISLSYLKQWQWWWWRW